MAKRRHKRKVKRQERAQRRQLHGYRAWRRELKKRRQPKLPYTRSRRLEKQPLQASTKWRQESETLAASGTFSIIQNPSETVPFLDLIAKKLRNQKPLMVDISQVRFITIDTLLYLIAIMDRMKALKLQMDIKGNLPSHPEANATFKESGFMDFVHSKSGTFQPSGNCVKITKGNDVDPVMASKLCVFAQRKLGVDRVATQPLYDMIVEIITNTCHHAYDEPKSPTPGFAFSTPRGRWYCYANYNEQSQEVIFSILDTGEGIPSTVRTNLREKFASALAALGAKLEEGSDEFLVTSALNGDLRSRTREAHRGKGLPSVKGFFTSGYISDLTVVSNKGFVSLKENKNHNMGVSLMGTLYSWRFGRDHKHRKAVQ
jgi:hypothetical protein